MKRIISSYQERKLSDLGDLYVWRILYVIDNTTTTIYLELCVTCYLNNFSCINSFNNYNNSRWLPLLPPFYRCDR